MLDMEEENELCRSAVKTVFDYLVATITFYIKPRLSRLLACSSSLSSTTIAHHPSPVIVIEVCQPSGPDGFGEHETSSIDDDYPSHGTTDYLTADRHSFPVLSTKHK